MEWLSGQMDAVAEKVESCASVHLSHDSLGADVDAFGSSVVVEQGDGTVHSGPVDFDAVGEAAYMWQIDRSGPA
ncbi:hypothetical protein GCM10011609_88380 [Lentzea pudingi]|uniref:Uncharacterized protein n=1 Tax=Lentzea pudingi TaxID=1789439 RepID=A0ABQ2ITZ1_9PSEU|nr:hypothetical protein GCM10011609_88380 [Lentzea pudingi]